jgi:hypothetical protein
MWSSLDEAMDMMETVSEDENDMVEASSTRLKRLLQ